MGELWSVTCHMGLVLVLAKTMLMVLSSYVSCESSPGSFDECSTSAGRPPPLDQADRPEPRIRLNWQLYYYTHHRYLLLLGPNGDTHYTIPRKVGG